MPGTGASGCAAAAPVGLGAGATAGLGGMATGLGGVATGLTWAAAGWAARAPATVNRSTLVERTLIAINPFILNEYRNALHPTREMRALASHSGATVARDRHAQSWETNP